MGAPTRIRTSDSLIGVSDSSTGVSGRPTGETAQPEGTDLGCAKEHVNLK
jgi:hypothetical protein